VTELVLIHPADAIPVAEKQRFLYSQSNTNIPMHEFEGRCSECEAGTQAEGTGRDERE